MLGQPSEGEKEARMKEKTLEKKGREKKRKEKKKKRKKKEKQSKAKKRKEKTRQGQQIRQQPQPTRAPNQTNILKKVKRNKKKRAPNQTSKRAPNQTKKRTVRSVELPGIFYSVDQRLLTLRQERRRKKRKKKEEKRKKTHMRRPKLGPTNHFLETKTNNVVHVCGRKKKNWPARGPKIDRNDQFGPLLPEEKYQHFGVFLTKIFLSLCTVMRDRDTHIKWHNTPLCLLSIFHEDSQI